MKLITFLIIILALASCNTKHVKNSELKDQAQSNEYFAFTKEKALEIVKTGFNAGDGYGEVWIRDYNTFIELSSEVFEAEVLKENLLVFFKMQGDDGNIIDGFIPREKAVSSKIGYQYIFSDSFQECFSRLRHCRYETIRWLPVLYI